jgi:hypothetical protein
MTKTICIQTATGTDERRAAPRSEWKAPLNIQPGPPAVDSEAVPAWAGNISTTGVCFRCRTRLPLGPIVLQPRGAQDAVTLQLVRERQICEGLWEYGATSCTGDETPLFQMPSTEFQDLLAALRVEVEGDGQVQHPPAHAASRELVLSLREVTRDAAECINRAYHQRRQRSYLRLVLWVAFIAGVACLSIDHVAAQFHRAVSAVVEAVPLLQE